MRDMAPALTAMLLVFVVGFAVLFIHKIGAARALRVIGHAFIAAGDAVDFWKARVAELNTEERQARPA